MEEEKGCAHLMSTAKAKSFSLLCQTYTPRPISNSGGKVHPTIGDKDAMEMLMSSHKISINSCSNLGRVEIFEEPMLQYLKLDDDIHGSMEEYGDLAQEIKERTVKGFNAFLDGNLDFSYHQYSIIYDLVWKHYGGKHEKAADCIIRTSLVLEARGNVVSAILQKNLALEMYKSLN
eukprot:5393057-Ditylum_brightwellii.AAC.1